MVFAHSVDLLTKSSSKINLSETIKSNTHSLFYLINFQSIKLKRNDFLKLTETDDLGDTKGDAPPSGAFEVRP